MSITEAMRGAMPATLLTAVRTAFRSARDATATRDSTRRVCAVIFLVMVCAAHVSALELNDCRLAAGPSSQSIAARCGRLTRPLDPSDPGGETIELYVAVVPSRSLEPAADPLVPIAGGPGQSAVEFYAGWSAVFDKVREHRDILLVDQRGTGDSAPLRCDLDDRYMQLGYSPELTLAATQACLDALPIDPRFFTTSIAVQDIEAVRQALGYEQLNLYGISYGTRVAQHFARRFPESTRTVLIDGVLPPQKLLGPDIAIESQRALDRVFDRCESSTDCNERFPALRKDFVRLLEQLSEEAVVVSMPHPTSGVVEEVEFGREQLVAAIRLMLYSPRTIALLPLLIDEASSGNYTPLSAQYQMVEASLSDTLSVGMHNTVMCSEDIPYIDRSASDDATLAATYMGTQQLDLAQTMCSLWPRGPMDADLHEPLSSDLPVLLLSGDSDPITPPAYAEQAATELSNARLITGINQGHGLGNVGCTPILIDRFIRQQSLSEEDDDCLKDAFAMPFFLDFTGPLP